MSRPTPPHLIDSGPLLEATGLVHRLAEPSTPGPYPTVIMLHGRYGNEDMMWIFGKSIPVQWLKIAPRGILPDQNGSFSWVSQEFGSWPALAQFEKAVAALHTFIKSLPGLYNTDPERIYLMGFSQGAAVAYATAMRYPGLVRGIAGLVGYVPQDCSQTADLATLRDLPIFMAVGKKDERVPYERGLNCAGTLLEANANLTYREYDIGHKLNAQGLNDLQKWWNSLNL